MKKRNGVAVLALALLLLTGCSKAQSGASSQPQLSPSQQSGSASSEQSSQPQQGSMLVTLQPILDNYSVAYFEDRDEEPGSSYFRTVLTATQQQELKGLLPEDQWKEMEPPEYGVTMLLALGDESGEMGVVSVSLLSDERAMITLHPLESNVPVKCWSVPADRKALENFTDQLLQAAKEKSGK